MSATMYGTATHHSHKKISSFEPLTNGLKFSILVKILQSYSNFSESPRVITPRGVNLPGVSYCAESISPGNHTAHRVNLPGYYTVQSQSPQGIMLRIEHRLTIPRSAIYFVFTIELNLLLPCFGLSALYLRIYWNSWPSPPAQHPLSTAGVSKVHFEGRRGPPPLFSSCCTFSMA